MSENALLSRLEDLSKLRLEDGEKEKIQSEINEIIEYFSVLSKHTLDGKEPLTHLFSQKNVMRKDEKEESLPQSESLKNAAVTENGFIVIPREVGDNDGE